MAPLIWTTFALIVSIPSVLSSPYPLPRATCDKSALDTGADTYVAAQTNGYLNTLHSLFASNFTYLENNKEILTEESILKKALKIEHRRTTHDLTTCATYTELIAPSGPYVIGTQIRHDVAGKIVSIDSITSTTGAWLFNATKTLSYVLNETWAEIPPGKQDSRDVIKAAGDAYLDMWSSATADSKVPWGTPCVRLEGSVYTGTGSATDSCKPGIPSNHSQAPNIDRRYVIDESMGSVSIFNVWQHMMNASDSHEFRLEGGKLRYVHTMTSCGDKVCKL